jgi:hypothetical protein
VQGFRGDIAKATNRYNLYMSGTADNYILGALGIGSTSLSSVNLRVGKSLTGATTFYNVQSDGTVQSDVTGTVALYRTLAQTAAATFTLDTLQHYVATQNVLGLNSAITNQYGFAVASSLTGATNNYGFHGAIASGTGRWNLFMAGTADNYLGGHLGIFTSTPTAAIDVNANTIRVRTAKTPASATATGNAGDICWDANYVYVCVATNTWKRSALTTW